MAIWIGKMGYRGGDGVAVGCDVEVFNVVWYDGSKN